MEKEKQKYIIKIYDIGHEEPPYHYNEEPKDPKPVIMKFANNTRKLFTEWKKLLKRYEGWAYTVFDMNKGQCVVGGAFDPNDIEYIIEYINEFVDSKAYGIYDNYHEKFLKDTYKTKEEVENAIHKLIRNYKIESKHYDYDIVGL